MRAFDARHHYYDDGTKNWITISIQTTHRRIFIIIFFIILFHLFVSSSAQNKMNDLMCNKDKKISGFDWYYGFVLSLKHKFYVVQCIWMD